MKRILLHSCCGPCLTHCTEFLCNHGYTPTIFFSNSNIMPVEEYAVRLAAAQKYAEAKGIEFIEDPYDNASWLAAIRGLESAPEGGARCSKCFEYNLARAAHYALEHDYPEFTTSLTVSPHKRSAVIFEIGETVCAKVLSEKLTGVSSLQFMHYDFKKQNGFLNSLRLAKEFDLYRQSYCGCIFSKR